MIEQDAFLEHAEVFGNYYGTSRAAIEQVLATGVDVFLDIDWQGAQQIRAKMPQAQHLHSAAVEGRTGPPPAGAAGFRRGDRQAHGSGRGGNDAYAEYDYLIVNDDFDLALSDLKTIIRAERLRLGRQLLRHDALISKLLAD